MLADFTGLSCLIAFIKFWFWNKKLCPPNKSNSIRNNRYIEKMYCQFDVLILMLIFKIMFFLSHSCRTFRVSFSSLQDNHKETDASIKWYEGSIMNTVKRRIQSCRSSSQLVKNSYETQTMISHRVLVSTYYIVLFNLLLNFKYIIYVMQERRWKCRLCSLIQYPKKVSIMFNVLSYSVQYRANY